MRAIAKRMKQAAPQLAASAKEVRDAALCRIAEALEKHREEIFAANREDLAAAEESGVSEAVKKRLKFDEGKLTDCVAGIRQLTELADPLGRTTLHRQLDEELILRRVTVPIGVIGVIFEARPDALVQISTLCVKSGNCAILKGGKETARTNRALFDVIHAAATEAGLPEDSLFLAETHSEIDALLACDGEVDLLIPRGSNAFVRYIMDNTKIPVMGHADGICHIYADASCDQTKAVRILVDAKTQYTAACNAVETLLVDRRKARQFLPEAAEALNTCGVKIFCTQEVADILEKEARDGGSAIPVEVIAEDDFAREYLDLAISVKLVDGVEEAIRHINTYGSHHTDAILAEDRGTAEQFLRMVDSAGVYVNCSTRFADGFRYGFGAEVGISTGKIHARGPVGLEGLVTYKYELCGNGQIVGDYASGVRTFHFSDLDNKSDNE